MAPWIDGSQEGNANLLMEGGRVHLLSINYLLGFR